MLGEGSSSRLHAEVSSAQEPGGMSASASRHLTRRDIELALAPLRHPDRHILDIRTDAAVLCTRGFQFDARQPSYYDLYYT